MGLFLVPIKGGIGGIYSPNWQYIPLIYHLYIAFWGVICYLPPFTGTENKVAGWYGALARMHIFGFELLRLGSWKMWYLWGSWKALMFMRIHFTWQGHDSKKKKMAFPCGERMNFVMKVVKKIIRFFRFLKLKHPYSCLMIHVPNPWPISILDHFNLGSSNAFCSTLNTNVITGLDMCKVCTEAVHCVALWTRT